MDLLPGHYPAPEAGVWVGTDGSVTVLAAGQPKPDDLEGWFCSDGGDADLSHVQCEAVEPEAGEQSDRDGLWLSESCSQGCEVAVGAESDGEAGVFCFGASGMCICGVVVALPPSLVKRPCW